jgi:O-antigen ligase
MAVHPILSGLHDMIRRYILFFISVSALCGALTAVFATLVERDYQLRGYVDPTDDANLPFREPLLGVNADLTQYSDETLLHQLELMASAHITWVRQYFYWDQIEPVNGNFQWAESDRIIDVVARFPSLRLVAVLMNSPGWSRSQGTVTGPPDDIQDFVRFSSAFAERYASQVDHYQIWDEPNLTAAWGNREPRAAQYAGLLNAAYAAIHNADGNATVIAAALAPTVEEGPDNVSDLSFLRDLYQLGAQNYMDAVAGKPYGFNTAPDDREVSAKTLNFSRIVALREEMVRQGDGHKALWASHWGWNALPPDWSGSPSIWGQVSSDERIVYTLDALTRAEREWPWLGGMILHHWQPNVPEDDPSWGFSVIAPDQQPTPLWAALAQRNITPAAANGLYAAANPYARYSGVWTFGPLGADIGWIDDSQLMFEFKGSDLALLLRKDDYVAYLYPTVDGENANAAPVDPAGNAYILLTSSTREPVLQLVPVSRNLTDTVHTLHIIADDLVLDEAQARWALVGYAVSSGNLRTIYDRQIAVGWLTAAVAAAAVLLALHQIELGRSLHWFNSLWRSLSIFRRFVISGLGSLALMIGMLMTWGEGVPALFRRETPQIFLAMLTAGLIYLEPGLILTLAALVFLLFIIYNHPVIGLVLTLFWSPFYLFPVQLFHYAFPMAEMLVLVTFAGAALRVLTDWAYAAKSEIKYRLFTIAGLNQLDWAVLLWILLALFSLAWADIRSAALTDLRVMFIEPILFYAVIRIHGRERQHQILLVDTLLAAGLSVAILGLWLYFRGEAIITAEEGALRLASVYGSPNNLSLFLGRCIPFAFVYTVWPVGPTRRRLSALSLAAMSAAVILSQSAGALLLALPASIVIVLILLYKRQALVPLGALLVTGIGAFTALILSSARFSRILDFSSGTMFTRIRVWQSSINVIRDAPLTGLGLDQFLYAFRSRYIMPDAWQEPDLSHPHNFVFDIWIRLGIGGILIFAWMQYLFWAAVQSHYKYFQKTDKLLYCLVVGLIGSMVNLLVHGLVDNSIFVHDLSYVFFLLLALAANLRHARITSAAGENPTKI